MTFKKSMMATAVGLALGAGSIGVASAAAIVSMKIEDVGSNTANAPGMYSSTLDGTSGAFKFAPINIVGYGGTNKFTGDAPSVATSSLLWQGNANATGSYTTGFLFTGLPFIPYTFGSGLVGDITGTTLTETSFDFGGNYAGGANFNLPPDAGTFVVNWVNTTATTGVYTVNFQWSHDITSAEDPSGNFSPFTASWVLEGTVKTTDFFESAVPVPAAVWLLGSGLVGLAGVARRKKKA